MKKYPPEQAVILAGGLGTRLKPLTDDKPKAMVCFHGKPFLENILEMLAVQGIKKILLLTGYYGHVIQDYFKDGSKLGLEIVYHDSPPEVDTGERMRRAQALMEEHFLFLYCDNYWPMNLKAMWKHFIKNPTAKGMLTLYSNTDGYTKDNIKIHEDGAILCYDKKREKEGLKGVDIGYGFFEKSVLDLMPEGNVSFEASVYPQLVDRGLMRGYVSGHRYYSVSTHERLHLTEAFLSFKPTIILDRDGVLNVKASQARYVRSWDEWEWIEGSKEAVGKLKKAGYQIFLVTNQAGIARGAMSLEGLFDLHQEMQKELSEVGGEIDKIYYCPHGWDEGCECRKPRPGMLFQAQREQHLDLSRCLFIGDDERDVAAGQAAGCPTKLVTHEKPLSHCVNEILGE